MSRYDKEKEGRKVGGDGREEGEGGKVKKEGGKKEGVNVFMLSKKVLLLIRAACLQCILDSSLT